MNADQLVHELFVNHWLLTTLVLPEATFLYAWHTNQAAWGIFSLMLVLARW